MEELNVINAALEHATKQGAFNMTEVAEIIKALSALKEKLDVH
jgi:hypothetical protein